MTSLTILDTSVPALAKASDALRARIMEVQENFATVENFKIHRIKMTGEGAQIIAEEKPLKEIEGVIIFAKRTNIYYDKIYRQGTNEPPRCMSLNGIVPVTGRVDKDGKPLPVIHPTCKGCPKAEFGTNLMGSGKACRNLKPIFMLMADDAIIPLQLNVPPTSLKLADTYFTSLAAAGMNFRTVKTLIKFEKKNPGDTYVQMKFSVAGRLTPEQANDAKVIKEIWMGAMSEQTIDHDDFEPVVEKQPIENDVDLGGEF